MENSPNIHFMSVSEAIVIMQKHNSVDHAVLEILNESNISITNASRCKYRWKLFAASRQKSEALRCGRLAVWLADAAKEEFCQKKDTQRTPRELPLRKK